MGCLGKAAEEGAGHRERQRQEQGGGGVKNTTGGEEREGGKEERGEIDLLKSLYIEKFSVFLCLPHDMV